MAEGLQMNICFLFGAGFRCVDSWTAPIYGLWWVTRIGENYDGYYQ